MCGIAAIIGYEKNNLSDSMEQMLNLIEHRGPDESDIVSVPHGVIGHKRLSIIGPDDGIQPIPNETKDAWIICNGEIYNYQSIKEKSLQGHSFIRHSDSEVPLHLYEEFGVNAVDYLDGMFAFVIADYRTNQPTLFAARDPLGIKPLYYGKKDDAYYFASELKCLYGVADEIKEFPQGHYFTPETGFVPYRLIKTNSTSENDLEAVMKTIRKLLEKAVQKRLMSDVPLGVLLSGGLDSSLVAAIANRYYQGKDKLKSFCVGLKGSPDILAARRMAEHLGTDHYEYIYTEEELLEAIPKVIYHLESFEAGLVKSAVPTYFVSKLAAQHVKVILSGEGADELFSGYTYFKDFAKEEELEAELVRTLNSLHNINLQRLDRMSMAHSLEGRVPFLDEELIRYSLKIPVKWKLLQDTDAKLEKWILRKAFSETGYLPDEILWRKKSEFAEGSGSKDLLEATFEKTISDQEFESEQNRIKQNDQIAIRSKEELYFYRIFKTYYPEKEAAKTVGRWATI